LKRTHTTIRDRDARQAPDSNALNMAICRRRHTAIGSISPGEFEHQIHAA
jgi:hypothetical protein